MDSFEANATLQCLPQPRRCDSSSLLDTLDLSKSRESLIRDTAYVRAVRRGFAPGSELEDWLAAEQEVDRYLAREIPMGFYG